jgi:hypothetical protein
VTRHDIRPTAEHLRAGTGRNEPRTARLIGYWKASLRDFYALPQHFESTLDRDVRSRLVAYLDDGVLVNQYRGHSHCRYGCGENGSAERSDGAWVWPTGLSHYVAVHGVVLPNEFRAHIDSSNSPDRAGLVGMSNISVDETSWVRWSQERMPLDYKAGLERAIAAADLCAADRLTRTARENEARLGLSSTPCIKHGCANRACVDRALCGRCLAEGDGTMSSIRRQCDSEQLHALLGEFVQPAR